MPTVFPFDGGRLLVFGGTSLEELAPLLRRLSASVEAGKREEDHLAAQTLADRANAIARSAARRFETLFEGLPIASYACDAEGRLMEWNQVAEETWPALTAAWGEDVAPLVESNDPTTERAMLTRALNGEKVNAQERETRVSGESRCHLVFAFPLRDAEESIVGVLVTRLDITRQREIQRELADREARLRTVIETLHEGLIVIDEAGRVVLRNQSAERILRLESGPMELTAAYPDGTVVDGEGKALPVERRPIIVALRTGRSARDVRLGLVRPGSTECVWVSVNAEPLFRSGDGAPMGAIATFREMG